MSALIFSFSAAGCAALANLFFRKNILASKISCSSNGYLLLYYFFSLVSSLIFYQDIWKIGMNLTVIVIGACVGLLNVALMFLMSEALKRGPAGLIFAFQNASAVFPGLLLFTLFGSSFGFSYSFFQLFGMVLVVFGLALGVNKKPSGSVQAVSKWLIYAIACFVVQIFALTLIQGRCVLFDLDESMGFLSLFALKEAEDVWFMPWQFGTAFCVQLMIFLREKRGLYLNEVTYGLLGGFANFASTCLLLYSTKIALSYEKVLIFPSFAVATIILCSIWANRLYGENFNAKAIAVCACGVFIGIFA